MHAQDLKTDRSGVTVKPILTWILIADSARAKVFVNDGPGRGIRPVSEGLRGRNRPGQEIMSDRPGRTFDSVGAGRHATVPKSDPREVDKRRFAHELAAMLDNQLNQGRFERLILVSPPQKLGRLRSELSPAVRDRVVAELNKDLTSIAIRYIPEHLGAVLAV